jgi:Homeodomain-like domain
MKKYIVRLEAEERSQLEQMVRTGKRAAYVVRHANILLAVDESEAGKKMSDEQAAHAYGVAVRSIEHLRRRLLEEGLEAALGRKKQTSPSVERLFDGEREAKLIAVACGPKPEGRTRWTLELLADRVVKLKIVPACSAKTVGRVLKKRTQAVAAENVVYSAGSRRRLCLRNGERPGRLQAAVRAGASGGLFR